MISLSSGLRADGVLDGRAVTAGGYQHLRSIFTARAKQMA
jgi:hypothetical protein